MNNSPPQRTLDSLRLKVSLRPTLLLMVLATFLISAAAVTYAIIDTSEQIIEHWAEKYTAKQAQFEKSRTLQPLLREIQLAKQVAQSKSIINWVKNPTSDELKQKAFSSLEGLRLSFHDQNYFVTLLSNGDYYYNNKDNEFAGRELRYTLNPANQKDRWFYDLIEQNRDLHINISPDETLGITQLWVDVLIRDEQNTILGMIGTGLDLDNFIHFAAEDREEGVTSFFIDHDGAIQLHHNLAFIDFASVSKNLADHKNISLIFDSHEDIQAIYRELAELEQEQVKTETLFVDVQGRRTILAIAYMPEIEWFQMTLIDLETVLPISSFSDLGIIYLVTLLITLVLIAFVINRWILTPITKIVSAMDGLEKGDEQIQIKHNGIGEIAQLSKHFAHMAENVNTSRRELEQKVKSRTSALERLSHTDSLTGLFNRRGMTQRVESALRSNQSAGILWIDVDDFKSVNDNYSHIGGDAALRDVANIITDQMGSSDLASRWGGDEFLIFLAPIDEETLETIANRICRAVNQHQNDDYDFSLSVSVGGYIEEKAKDIDTLLRHADHALYLAKDKGKNQYVIGK